MTTAADSAKTCRILALDGGGIRGVIPGQILVRLEEALGKPLGSAFHLIAGTSTGGILAGGIAKGLTAAQLLDFYFKDGSEIFNANVLGSIGGAKYSPAPLERILGATFGDTKLSELQQDLLIPTYDIQSRADLLFESWRARGIQEPDRRSSDFLLREAARATSAAPTYFPPALATAGDGRVYPCIDGGMYANSPALLAFVAARRLMPLATRFLIVSLGTGEVSHPLPYSDAKDWGLIGWAPKLIDVILTAMGPTVSFELDQLAPLVDQVRLQSSLEGASEDLDDASAANMQALKVCAERTLRDRAADVDRVVAELRQPLPDRLLLGYPSAGEPPRPGKLGDLDIQKIAQQAKAALDAGDWCAQMDALQKLGYDTESKSLESLCVAQRLANQGPPVPPPPTGVSVLRGILVTGALGLFLFGPVGGILGAIMGLSAGRPDLVPLPIPLPPLLPSTPQARPQAPPQASPQVSKRAA